jgi:peptidoglycan/xylan/chitin deacetylase (PgdA/CDA1 family)
VYVLSYHHVVADPGTSRHDVTVSQLDAHLAFVKKWFQIVSIDEAVRLLKHAPLDRDYLAITFDDGYRDNYERALPVLRRHGVPATIFLIAGLVDTDALPWYDECRIYFSLLSAPDGAHKDVAAFPLFTEIVGIMTEGGALERRLDRALSVIKTASRETRAAILEHLRRRYGPAEARDEAHQFKLMGWEHVREMTRYGISYGCHTMTHPILSTLPVAQIEAEVRESRSLIEQHVGTDCRTFAYPNGDFDDQAVAVLRQMGFASACTQVFGANRPGADPLKLRRVAVGATPTDLLAVKLSGLLAPAYAIRKWGESVIVDRPMLWQTPRL